MTPDRPRAGMPLGALALVGLLIGDVRGWVDPAALARTGGTVVAAAALEGADVLASMVPTFPTPAKPRRKHRRPASATNRAGSLYSPGRNATKVAGIPPIYRRLYREAGAGRDGRPEMWCTRAGDCYRAQDILAGIGLVESSHGRSNAPGVRSGVNAFGCCAGPMQFNLRNGPPSTWDTWGRGNVYDPRDAIPAAARKLRGDGARRDLDGALLAYNASWSYVNGVKAQARRYQKGI